MKKWILLATVALLALPTVAKASDIDFSFGGGTISAISGPALSGSSTLTQIFLNPPGPGSSPGFSGILGTVTFTTGSLASGNLAAGGTLNSGGIVTVTANGTWGSISSGTVIYSGTFSGPVTWTPVGLSYILSGPLTGSLNSALVALMVPGCSACTLAQPGALATLTVTVSNPPFKTSAGIASGNITSQVPEPGTMALFGAGLFSIAGAIRRRMAKP